MRYNDKLKHPLWQKKRLQIMERDEFMCTVCNNPLSQLHVHHTFYDSKIKYPWEYPDNTLVTLCDSCHNDSHNSKIGAQSMLLLNLFCKLIDKPPCFVEQLKIEITYNINVMDMTEKESIKKAFLELIKPA